MIADNKKLTEFLMRHKKKKNSSLWAMAHKKDEVIKELNFRINSQTYYFSDRVTKMVGDKKITFYKEWDDRFVDFCLSSYLRDLYRFAKRMGLYGLGIGSIKHIFGDLPIYPW